MIRLRFNIAGREVLDCELIHWNYGLICWDCGLLRNCDLIRNGGLIWRQDYYNFIYHRDDTRFEMEHKGQVLSHDSHKHNNKIDVQKKDEGYGKRKV